MPAWMLALSLSPALALPLDGGSEPSVVRSAQLAGLVDDLDAPPPAPPPASRAASTSDGPQRGIGLRYRYTALPQAFLNPWYFKPDKSGHPRPGARAHIVGLEYTVDRQPAFFTGWAEYWAVNMDEGYWDDKEQPPDHTDGDWLRPIGLAMLAVGGNFGHEFGLTPKSQDVWLGLALSGGVGLGIPFGRFEQWYPGGATEPLTDCHPNSMSTVRYLECPPDREVKPPPVLPVLDLTVGVRIHVMERAVFRVEGGFHGLPYFGLAGGAVF